LAQINGYDGLVHWSDTAISDHNIHAWTVDVTADVADVTDFASTGWRSIKAGLKNWTGSMELYTDSDNMVVPSDVGSTQLLKLYLDGTNYLQGHAICSGYHPAVSVDSVETQTLDFQGTSDLIYL